MTPALAYAIASVGGLGHVPKVGRVVASILGLALAVGADRVGGVAATLALGLALAALGVWTAEAALRAASVGLMAVEPSRLVVRDLAGQALTMVLAPVNPAGLLLAFGAYQLFVLARPWPALETVVPVPRGVALMAEGVFAAVGAGLIIGFMTWMLGTV